MKLTEYLNNCSGKINFLFTNIELKPHKILKISKIVEEKYSLGQMEIPPVQDLADFLDEIELFLSQNGSLRDISLKNKRKIPWLLFFPNENSGLSKSSEFLYQMKDFLFSIKRVSQYHSYFFNFIKFYPIQEQNFFSIFINWINDVLKGENLSRRVQDWLKYNEKFHFFDKFGYQELSKKILKFDINSIELNSISLLQGELKISNFFKQVTIDLLTNTSNWLYADLMTVEKIKNVIEFLAPEKKLRFSELKAKMANSFLEPFYEKECQNDLKKIIRIFCIDFLGHPNMFSEKWVNVSPSALAVIKKWLVGQTLDTFFGLISESNEQNINWDKHWAYRQAFWKAYYHKGYISDAWVILGKNAINLYNSKHIEEKLQFGIFEKGSGVSRHESALLLKIKNLIFMEWSNVGKACKIWFDDNQNKPEFGKIKYRVFDLKYTNNHKMNHYSPESGSWQRILRDWIESYTKAYIERKEYMPKKIDYNMF